MSDERCIQEILSGEHRGTSILDRRTRALVELAALLVADAATASLRWAVDAAWSAGVDDAALVQVLVSSARDAGTTQTVSNAPRLALALGLDVEAERSDAADAPISSATLPGSPGKRPLTARRRRAYGTPRAPAS